MGVAGAGSAARGDGKQPDETSEISPTPPWVEGATAAGVSIPTTEVQAHGASDAINIRAPVDVAQSVWLPGMAPEAHRGQANNARVRVSSAGMRGASMLLEPPILSMQGAAGWQVVDPEIFAHAVLAAGARPSANEICTLLRGVEI